jgi:hypothetical protein
MVDRDVRRNRRVVVRHAIAPPAEPASGIPASRTAPGPGPATNRTPTPDPAPAPVGPPAPADESADHAPEHAPDHPADHVPDPALDPAADVRADDGAEDRSEKPADDRADAAAAEPAHVPPPPARTRIREGSPYGFPTEALLDDHVAAADELRADLARLRAELADGPPPLPPPRRRRRGPVLGALVVGGTLAVIGTAVLVPWSDLDLNSSAQPDHVTAATDRTQARPNAVTPPAPAPRLAPAGSLPASGPGIDQPGTMMVVQVAKDGSLNVTEQAVLGPRGLRQIDLRLPSMAALGGQVAELTPTVHNLRVSVNGTAVPVIPTADGPGWQVTAAGGERARTVQLSYQMRDAIVRTKPSASGRALGVSLPLLGQALREQGLPLVVRAEGPAVGGATCPSAPITTMLCGEEVSNGWLATIPADAASPTLLLQLNLT